MSEKFVVSTDRARLDLDLIHGFLSRQSYWCRGIPRATVERAIANSLCFGIYTEAGSQVGFARVVTDYATYGYVADVFVLPEWRGRGLSKRLVQTIVDDPALQGFRRLTLATRDAQGLYAQFGFKTSTRPDWQMERFNPTVYGDPL
jgi:N-acetylglutamate synthase-like GNAT family acetyltransferase